MNEKDPSTESSQVTTDEGTYERIPNDIVREGFGDKIDSVNAEKVAADWENGPWKSTKPFKGITNPAGCNNRESCRRRRVRRKLRTSSRTGS